MCAATSSAVGAPSDTRPAPRPWKHLPHRPPDGKRLKLLRPDQLAVEV